MTENLHRRHFLCFVTKLQKTFIVHADKCLYTSMWNDEKRFQEINLKNKQRQKQDLENRNHMLRELIVSRDMSVASHWSVIARGHGARQIMQSMDPALLLTLWLCFKCEWKGRFMNLSVIVKQRLKSDVLGNRAAPLPHRGPFLRRVIFGIRYTFGVVDVWTLPSQTLLQRCPHKTRIQQ